MAESTLSIDYQQLYKEIAQQGWGSHTHKKGTITISNGVVTFTSRLSVLAQIWATQGGIQVGTNFYTINTITNATTVTLTDTSIDEASAVGFVMTQASEEVWEKINDIIDGGLRKFRGLHDWRFLRPGTTISTVASYSTGTVTISSGVVTFSTTLPTIEQGWAASGDVTVDGKEYSVNTYDSSTQVMTLDDTSVTAAAGTKFILSQTLYDLPDNYGHLIGPLTHVAGESQSYPQLQVVDESMFWRGRQRRSYTQRPRHVMIRVKTHDATKGTRFEIAFGPALPDSIYTFRYNYSILQDELTPANRYPHGGMKHAETIRCACRSVCETELNQSEQGWTQLFMAELQGSIKKDAEEAPDHLGYNSDPSDRRQVYREQPWSGSSVYEGHTLT